jgi:membrane protein
MPSSKLSLLANLTRLWDPAHLRAWSRRHRGDPGWRAFAVHQAEVFILTARSVYREEITLRAAALTYNTVLSIVPLFAVGFALFQAFGGLKKLEGPLRQLVVENLAVGRAEEVGLWLDKIVANISAGAIAGFGVILLFYSAVGLLTNIESSINKIWGITRGRSIFIRFAIYWCLVTLAPPLLGISVSFSARLQSSAFATTVLAWLPFGLGRLLLSLSSVLSVSIAFVLTYLIVPATKVRFKAALLGGIVAGVLWSIGKFVFIALSAGTLKYSAVYGALGVLPLLMLWIYASWIIVLFGATYAFANHSVSTESLEAGSFGLAQASRELLAVRLAVAVATEFHSGRRPPPVEALAAAVGADLPFVRHVLGTLVAQGILVETGPEGDAGHVPARDIQELTVAEILDALRQKDGLPVVLEEDRAATEVRRVLDEAAGCVRERMGKVDLRSLALRAQDRVE